MWMAGGSISEMWLGGAVRLPQGLPPHDYDKTGWARQPSPMTVPRGPGPPGLTTTTPVVPPQLGHISSPEAVPAFCQPVAQPRRAGRRSLGRQQTSHETDNLVMGERHVTHQQTHQPGQRETHARRRV